MLYCAQQGPLAKYGNAGLQADASKELSSSDAGERHATGSHQAASAGGTTHDTASSSTVAGPCDKQQTRDQVSASGVCFATALPLNRWQLVQLYLLGCLSQHCIDMLSCRCKCFYISVMHCKLAVLPGCDLANGPHSHVRSPCI